MRQQKKLGMQAAYKGQKCKNAHAVIARKNISEQF